MSKRRTKKRKRRRAELEDDGKNVPSVKKRKVDAVNTKAAFLVFGYFRNEGYKSTLLNIPIGITQIVIRYIGERCNECNGNVKQKKCHKCKGKMCETFRAKCSLSGNVECRGCFKEYHYKCEGFLGANGCSKCISSDNYAMAIEYGIF